MPPFAHRKTRRPLRVDGLEPRLVPATPSVLTGRVWEDVNADGHQDPGEPGLAGVTIEVRGAPDVGRPLASIQTLATGDYRIPLPAGAVRAVVVPPPGFRFDFPVPSWSATPSDSDVDAETGAATVPADAGPAARVDAGLARTTAEGAKPFGFGYGVDLGSRQLSPWNSVALAPDGGPVVIGYTPIEPFAPVRDPFVARYGPDGVLKWRTSLGDNGHYPNAVATAPDGAVFVGSYPQSAGPIGGAPPATLGPPAVTRLAADGTVRWTKSLAAAGIGKVKVVAADGAGHVFVGGSVAVPGSSWEEGGPRLVRLSAATGAVEWARTFTDDGFGSVTAVLPDGRGGALFGGQSARINLTTSPGPMAALIGTVDTAGTVLQIWRLEPAFGMAQVPEVVGLARDAAGNVYAAGRFWGRLDFDPTAGVLWQVSNDDLAGIGNSNLFVARFGPDGRPAWVRTFGDGFSNYPHAFDRGADGSLYLAGDFSGKVDFDPGPGRVVRTGGLHDPFLLTLDADGRFVRLADWKPRTGPGWLSPTALRAAPGGGFVVAGSYAGAPDIDPTSAVRYLPSVDSEQHRWTGSFVAHWPVAGSPTPKPADPPAVVKPPVAKPPVAKPVRPLPVVRPRFNRSGWFLSSGYR